MTRAERPVVLLPVYNAQKYLHECIESILRQSLRDFEFLILDDGSTDRSEEIIRSFKDERIRFLKNSNNRGLIYTLNRGMEESGADIIVRMDADDVARPDRLEKLVGFLNEHPDHWLVYSQVRYFGQEDFISKFPLDHLEIKSSLLFGNIIAHPATAFRASFLKTEGLTYENEFLHTEDYRLWSKMIQKGKFACLPEVLLDYRMEGQNISLKNRENRFKTVQFIYKDLFESYGWSLTSEQIRMHGIFTGLVGFNQQDVVPFKNYIHSFQDFFGQYVDRKEAEIILEMFMQRIRSKYYVEDKVFKKLIFEEGRKMGLWDWRIKTRYYLGL